MQQIHLLISRVKLGTLLCLFILSLTSCQQTKVPQTSSDDMKSLQPSKLVYPFLDAANSRWFYFNSASRPFGMVNLSPDTQIGGAWGSGYRYDTDTIKGFSHIHAWQLSGLSVMPVVYHPEEVAERLGDYYSAFDHEKEYASPGYHQVQLDRYKINAELTSTKRVGFHRYQFPKSKQAGIVLNLGGKLGPSNIKDGSVQLESKTSFSGELTNSPTIRRPKDCKIFFYAESNWDMAPPIAGESGRFMIPFRSVDKTPLLLKIAISYTSIDNAKLNLRQELNHWDFEGIKADSEKEWDTVLGRIVVEGGTRQQQQRFYTDLWHALQGRRVISDVNGAYPDNTGEQFRIGQLPLSKTGQPKFNHYNSDSFWGAQWTLNTLWGLVYPEIYDEFVQSLLVYYQDGGLLPRGPSGGNYTHVMTGASSTPFVVSAYQKGIRGFNAEEAYQAMRKNHMPGGTMGRAGYEHKTTIGGGLEDYIQKGYVPHPNPAGKFGFHQDGASLTLEYAYQDWTLAQMAKALGKQQDYEYFSQRAGNYKNQFDPESGWIRPKDVDGNWRTPFDPYQHEHGFNESNGAQSTWFVPQDIPGLAELMGGKEKAVNKLNEQFEQAAALQYTAGNSHAQEAHPEYRRIPINYGNQPSIQTLSVFNELDRPDLNQYWTHKVIAAAYSGLSPKTGYNGDEDQGLMGSLAVLLKIGLFQMNGGTEENPVYTVGSPLFDKVSIQLNQAYYPGKTLEIIANNHTAENLYIESATFAGKPIQNLSVRHQDLIQGGRLELMMTNRSGE